MAEIINLDPEAGKPIKRMEDLNWLPMIKFVTQRMAKHGQWPKRIVCKAFMMRELLQEVRFVSRIPFKYPLDAVVIDGYRLPLAVDEDIGDRPFLVETDFEH